MITVESMMNAIAGQESGGDPDVTNPDTGAHGRWQILPSNWSSWAIEAGLASDAPKTLANQIVVVRAKLLQYFDRWDNWEDVAAAWYSGSPRNLVTLDKPQGNAPDGTPYPTIRQYVASVMARLEGDSMADPKWTFAPLKLWDEYPVTGPFGATSPAPWTPARPHMGLDKGVPEGFWLYAPAENGKVVEFTNDGSFGLGVCLDIPNTPYYSLFAHMSRVDVQVGDVVMAGQRLGLTGATGLVTGAHLHWQVSTSKDFPRDLAKNVDPLRFKAWDVPPPVSAEMAALQALNAAVVLRLAIIGIATQPDFARVEKAAAALRQSGFVL